MSEQHDPFTRTPSAQLVDNIQVARAHLGLIVQQLKGDENERWRQCLLGAVGDLDSLTDAVESGALHVQSAPAGIPAGVRNLRAIGEDTREGLRRLSSNRGGGWQQ